MCKYACSSPHWWVGGGEASGAIATGIRVVFVARVAGSEGVAQRCGSLRASRAVLALRAWLLCLVWPFWHCRGS